MKAGKLKKVLLPVLSLSLATMLTVMNVHATGSADSEPANQEQVVAESPEGVPVGEDELTGEDITNNEDLSLVNDSVTQQKSTEESENFTEKKDIIAKTESDDILKDLILEDVDLNTLNINDVSFYTYPIPVGTSSNSIIGYIKLDNDNGSTYGLIKLTGDMLDGFDSSEIGRKEYTISLGGWKHSVNVEVRQDSDINDVGKIVSTDVKVGFDSDKLANIILEGDTTIEHGHIHMLDKEGTNVCSIEFLLKDMVPDFNTSTPGTHSYTINYKGFPITFDTNIRRAAFSLVALNDRENPCIPISIGGDIRNAMTWMTIYDADNGSPYGAGPGFGYDSVIGKNIDNSKPGIQEIELKVKDDRGVIMTGTVKVKVGMPEQSTIEKLLSPKAQATMPGGTHVGIWDVPSGEAGAGTWTFQTDLSEGIEVVVWSFHNNEWLKIGIYKVDASGMVTVTFTADQLSPILITKNDANSGTDVNNGSGSSRNINTTSPKTGDNASTMIFAISTLASFAVLIMGAYMKRRKYLHNK